MVLPVSPPQGNYSLLRTDAAKDIVAAFHWERGLRYFIALPELVHIVRKKNGQFILPRWAAFNDGLWQTQLFGVYICVRVLQKTVLLHHFETLATIRVPREMIDHLARPEGSNSFPRYVYPRADGSWDYYHVPRDLRIDELPWGRARYDSLLRGRRISIDPEVLARHASVLNTQV